MTGPFTVSCRLSEELLRVWFRWSFFQLSGGADSAEKSCVIILVCCSQIRCLTPEVFL